MKSKHFFLSLVIIIVPFLIFGISQTIPDADSATSIDCGSFADEPTCISHSECSWDLTNNWCYYATSSDASGASVAGTVYDPNGNPLKDASVSVHDDSWSISWGSSTDSNGNYSISGITEGTYILEAFPPSNSSGILTPSPETVTLTDGQTLAKDFTFLASSKVIKGAVKFSDGTPVTDGAVYANQSSTGKSIHKDTDLNGEYSLSVGGGVWEVGVYPKSITAIWSYGDPPKSAVFAGDSSSEEVLVNFEVIATDARVKGRVVKSDGTVPSANSVFVDLYSQALGKSFGGSTDSSGDFSIAVSAETYEVRVFSNDTSFTAPALAPVSVSRGETKDLGTITLSRATKTLTGKVSYEDGRAVSDAIVGAYKKETQKWVDAQVDSFGNYSLSLVGGSWEISVFSRSQSPDWVYGKSPEIIIFTDDKTAESKIVNLIVTSAGSQVRGKILKPDGNAPKENTVFVDLWSAESSFSAGGSVLSDGSFRISVPAGSYNVRIHSQDTFLSAPKISPIVLSKGEIKDLGTIALQLRGDHIKGKVSDKNGTGLSNIRVDAWTREDSDYSSTLTDSSGNYDLVVTPGKWEVNAIPQDFSTDFYNPDPPKSVEVVSGVVSTVNFTLLVADSGITGNIVDSSGNIISDLYGFVNLAKTNQNDFDGNFGFGPGIGGQIERGKFSFKAPAGTYNLHVFLSPESPYTPKESQTVTLNSGETYNINITVSRNTSKITGTIKDKSGNAVTGVDVFIFATSKNGVWQEARVDKNTGRYDLKISAGTWYLGYHVEPESGYLSGEERRVEVVVGEGASANKDLVISKAGSKITGRVTKPSGAGAAYVFVEVSKVSFAGFDPLLFKSGEMSFVAGAMTDENGYYTINIPAGLFFVNVFVPPQIGFVSPKEEEIRVDEGEIKNLDFKLREADLEISGRVLEGGAAVNGAFVWAWSESGGYGEAKTDDNGNYNISVSGGTVWHIGASASINGEFYKSDEAIVAVSNTNVSQDISVSRISKLSDSATRTSDASEQTLVESADGASVSAPATSIQTSGSVTISVTPDTRVASQGSGKNVVGVSYELDARGSDGASVTSFNSDVTVSLPYKDSDLAALNISEDDLSLAFWDDTVATWKNVDSALVNKTDKLVTGSVNHFTRFAIVSAADVTPPQSPSSASALAIGDGKIKLTWVNPDKDFSHTKIYRSTISGEIGIVKVSEVQGVEYIDTGLVDGTIYYYTIRAVDPAGNESANIDQVSAVSDGGSIELDTSLKEGDLIRGPDGIKVYIINAFGYKRHIFNPAVFNMYGHFSWESIKDISQSASDSYKISDVYRSLNDPRVYSLEEVDEVNGIAIKHHVEMTAEQFIAEGYDWNQVFLVNDDERDYYQTGAPIKP